jgi:hypothetical protein
MSHIYTSGVLSSVGYFQVCVIRQFCHIFSIFIHICKSNSFLSRCVRDSDVGASIEVICHYGECVIVKDVMDHM